MTNILFGQSYFLRFDPKLWEAMQPYPPLGTLYAAAVARDAGYTVALFDAMLADSEADWARAVADHQPSIAILYEDNFNYLSKMCLGRMRGAAFTMIAAAKPATVIVCGSDATDAAEAYLAAGADYVLLGEGEATLADLLAALRTGADPAAIIGLAYQGPVGPVRNPRRPDIRDLDGLPRPAWDLVDIPRYQAIWRERHGRTSFNLVTTRGCPYSCNWCAKPIWGQRYGSRSAEAVADEVAYIAATYAPDHLWFADDIFGLKPGWIGRYADALAERGVRLPFKCLSRADLLLRPGDIPALARAGAETVWMGAESGSQAILDAMDKGTTVDQIRDAAARLKDSGIRVGFFLQFGYPGETPDDVERTLQLVRDCDPDDIGMSVSYPLPGTKFHDRVRADLAGKDHWIDSADLSMLYAGPQSTDYYQALHSALHKEFRARRLAADLRSSFPALRRRHLRGTAAMIYHWATLPMARRRLDRLAV